MYLSQSFTTLFHRALKVCALPDDVTVECGGLFKSGRNQLVEQKKKSPPSQVEAALKKAFIITVNFGGTMTR